MYHLGDLSYILLSANIFHGIFVFQVAKTSSVVYPIRYAQNVALWPLLLTWFNFNPDMDK